MDVKHFSLLEDQGSSAFIIIFHYSHLFVDFAGVMDG